MDGWIIEWMGGLGCETQQSQSNHDNLHCAHLGRRSLARSLRWQEGCCCSQYVLYIWTTCNILNKHHRPRRRHQG